MVPWVVWMTEAADAFVPFGIALIINSTVLIVLGIAAASLLRKRSTIAQNLFLKGILAALILMPVTSYIVQNEELDLVALHFPAVTWPGNALQGGDAIVDDGVPDFSGITASEKSVNTVFAGDSESGLESFAGTISAHGRTLIHAVTLYGRPVLYILFTSLWVFFGALYFVRFVFLNLRIIYLRITAHEPDDSVLAMNRNIAWRYGIKPPVVLESALVKSPLLSGALRPIILVPEMIETTEEMLIHEHAHLVRHDCFWNILSGISCFMYPLQPLMKTLIQVIELTNDYLCDEYVLSMQCDPHGYATQLYYLAEQFRDPKSHMSTGVYLVRIKASLKRRVARILDNKGRFSLNAGLAMNVSMIAVTGLLTAAASIYSFDSLPTKSAFSSLTESEPFMPTNDRGIVLMPQPARIVMTENTPMEPSQEIEIADETAPNNTIPDKAPNRAERTSDKDIEAEPKLLPPSVVHSDPLMNNDESGEAVAANTEDQALAMLDNIDETSIPYASPETISTGVERKTGPINPELARLNDIDPESLTDIDSCKEIGRKLLAFNSWKKAEDILCRAMEFNSEDAEVRNMLGEAYLGKRDDSLALLYFKCAIALDDKFAKAYYNVGRILQQKGDFEEAWSYYKVAINLNPAYAREHSVYTVVN